MNVEPGAVRAMIAQFLGDDLRAVGMANQEVDDELDLLLAGVVDSFRFVALMANLERRLDIRIDLTGMEPSDITRVGALSRYIAQVSASPRAFGRPPSAQHAPEEKAANG